MDDTNKSLTKKSRLLSKVLRHDPGCIGLTLDHEGWVSVSDLIDAVNAHSGDLTSKQLDEIVATSDKKRFAFNDDHTRIRANQGHSIEVDLALDPSVPPQYLYHGTSEATVGAILDDGITKMSRQYVHLSLEMVTAMEVGRRHGKPRVIMVDALKMHRDGHVFFMAKNGVWLTDRVPREYLLVC